MEEQIKEQFHKAFFDLLDKEGPESYDHLRSLMNEIADTLCGFVPTRTDIHAKIREELGGEIGWDVQQKLLGWIEVFQAPIYDQVTSEWKKICPEPIGQFLKKYYAHMEKVNRQIQDHKNSPPTLRTGR
jgi:hypothetical protein